MVNLSIIGKIFFGIAIIVMGLLTIYYVDFPYMLIPPDHAWIPGIFFFTYFFGTALFLVGICIVFNIKTKLISFLLGVLLLLVFCFYFIPYEFMVSENYMHFGDWENAFKELALCSGAFVIAGNSGDENQTRPNIISRQLISLGTVLFAITITSFGVNHFLFATEASGYIPSWIPYHLFWMYFTGTALLFSGIAIIFKIKLKFVSTLLGLMIFTWFIILHIPRIIASPAIDLASEITSAFIAFAYSGIANAIAGSEKKE